MAISIKDLAEKANVSTATVIRALKNKPDISEKTRQKILSLAEQYHYRPNILARGLVTQRSYTIGIIVPDIRNPFFPALIKGAEGSLWKDGYNVVLADTDYNTQKEIQIVNEMVSRQVDGIIISPTDVANNSEWYLDALNNNLPVVSITRIQGTEIDTVIADDRDAGITAANHLLSLGRKKILYLGNSSSKWANEERLIGLETACEQNGCRLDSGLIHSVAYGTMERSYNKTMQLLQSNIQFDSILAFDDMMAFAAKMAIEESGLRVPEDIALVGFDNLEMSSLPNISLTTIDIPKNEIGSKASSLLLERIDASIKKAEAPIAQEIVLKSKLIVRSSCGCKIPD